MVSLKLTRFRNFLLYFLSSIFRSTFRLFFEVQYTSPDSLFLSGINLSCDIVKVRIPELLKNANLYKTKGRGVAVATRTPSNELSYRTDEIFRVEDWEPMTHAKPTHKCDPATINHHE